MMPRFGPKWKSRVVSAFHMASQSVGWLRSVNASWPDIMNHHTASLTVHSQSLSQQLAHAQVCLHHHEDLGECLSLQLAADEDQTVSHLVPAWLGVVEEDRVEHSSG